jgi:shikimate kinase
MSPDANIILAGPMGAGKTVAGEIVAEKLGRQLWDTDRMIEEQTGLSIVRIFSERSEAFFRSLEREVVKAIVREHSLVVAVGGGMTVPNENLSDLMENGIVICLMASAEVLAERLSESCCRPLLMGDNLDERVARILDDRKQSYARIPLQLDNNDLTIEETAARVIEIYREQTSDV